MKMITRINPKKLFKKKTPSVSRSEQSSFSSGTMLSDSPDSSRHGGSGPPKDAPGASTPTSVLPSHSDEISSDDWSEMTGFELAQAFKIIDVDGDGRITRSELVSLLSRVGSEPPTEEDLTMMLSEVDLDGDGSISLDEFGAISSAFAMPACHDELREAFEFFDADHDGKITANELFSVYRSIGDERCTLEDCRRMISGVDKNGDGFVCFGDFALMMEQQR